MAAPSAPTLTTIVTEALKKAGYSSPASAMITRAGDEWMEEVKNTIWLASLTAGTSLKSLMTDAIQITTNGLSLYSNPSDYSSDLSLTAMYGTHIGTAQGGGAASITLASSEDVTETEILGREVLIYAGTAKNEISQIVAYNSTTKVITVSPSWGTQPVSGDSYMIVDTYYPLIQKPIWELDALSNPTDHGVPSHWFPIGDSTNGKYRVYPAPYDATAPFGIRMRYFSNLMKLDLAGTLMATLYQRWRNIFEQGVMARALEDMDDDRAQAAQAKFGNLIQGLLMREAYGIDMGNLRCTIGDYS